MRTIVMFAALVLFVGDARSRPQPGSVRGTVTVPLYLEGDGPSTRDSAMHRDARGLPVLNEMVEVPFAAQIPRSVYEAVRAGAETPRPTRRCSGCSGRRADSAKRSASIMTGWCGPLGLSGTTARCSSATSGARAFSNSNGGSTVCGNKAA